MSNKAGILSVTRTAPHEYSFEIALSETADVSSIHDVILTATVPNVSVAAADLQHQEARVLRTAQDCITARLEEIKHLQDAQKKRIIDDYEKQKSRG